MTRPRILIGIPAFRGARFICETLDSISKQDHCDFRALISIDGGDTDTAAACVSFLADSRFSLVTQDRRLGWDGNINWLMSRPDYDFFCYWPQDDLTSTNYLSELLKAATTNPFAVCYFSDIQWMGLLTHRLVGQSVTGFSLDRAISVFETLNGMPQRGLIRKSAIDRVGPVRRTEYESAFEEFIWVAKLAREGNLHHVEGPIYFKRFHEEGTHKKWHDKDRLWKRAVWLEFGLGMLDAIWPLVSETERVTALATVLDRLCIPKEGRFFLYDGPPIPFASDFLVKALKQVPIPSLDLAVSEVQAWTTFAGGVAGELLDQAIAWSKCRPAESLIQPSEFQFRFGDRGIDLLCLGWSTAETWGTWSVGPLARMHLPVPAKGGKWKVAITFKGFGKEGSKVSVHVTIGRASQTLEWLVPANQIVQKELTVESDSTDVILQFTFPDATSPRELGINDDSRHLGMGLISLELTPWAKSLQ